MRKISLALALIAGLFALPAHADFTGKNAGAATITFKNAVDCTAAACVPAFNPVDSTGANFGVAANPIFLAFGTGIKLPDYTNIQAFKIDQTTDGTTNLVRLGAETTKVIGTVRIASGGVASGSYASGAFASGAFASGSYAAGAFSTGSIVDGAYLTDGAIADAVVAAGATGSNSAKLRRLTTDLDAAKTSLASIDTKASQPLPAQTGIGNVNIGAVQSAGSNYETVAASQTAQAMGPTGATGDYLSHCVIYPASTSPGVVTVFDNTNAAGTNVIAFAGGATSTSNLTPISVPVGAISTAGPWKVTTGASVSVTCYGKFT